MATLTAVVRILAYALTTVAVALVLFALYTFAGAF